VGLGHGDPLEETLRTVLHEAHERQDEEVVDILTKGRRAHTDADNDILGSNPHDFLFFISACGPY
jgi:hypothetical protein